MPPRLRALTLALTLSFSVVAGSPAPVRAAGDRLEQRRVPGRVLVRFDAAASSTARARALASVGGRIVDAIPQIGFSIVGVRRPVIDAVERLRAHPAIDVAEPSFVGRVALDPPGDPCAGLGCGAGRQWNLDAVAARAGWERFPATYYSREQKRALPPETAVKVAVLDTRIDIQDPDWQNDTTIPVTDAYDARNGGQLDMADEALERFLPSDTQQGSALFHGTFVAGIIAASANNGFGIAGVGYHAQIMPITVVNGDGVANSEDVAKGLVWAADHGARVVNLSLVFRDYSIAMQSAIHHALLSGALVVAAAGNDGKGEENPTYPAQMPGVTAVAATDEADRRGSCSNFGGNIAVAAPGVGILSIDSRGPGGVAVTGCGTSTAAPHVSALAALLFAQDPSRTAGDVRTIITQSADDDRFVEGVDEHFGAGRINVDRALRSGQGPRMGRIIATVPPAFGGTSSITSDVRLREGSSPVTKAEMFFDTLGAEGTGTSVAVEATEDPLVKRLAGQIDVPVSIPSGVHRVFVRAYDGAWSGAASGVLIVDRTPPVIEKVTASNAITPLGMPVRVTFDLKDDYALNATYTIEAYRRYQNETQAVYRSEPKSAGVPASVATTWLPPLTEVGSFRIVAVVEDEAGNKTRSKPVDVLVV